MAKEDYPARRAEIEARLEVLEAEKEQLEAELWNFKLVKTTRKLSWQHKIQIQT